jgi:hypothetical protein
MDSSAIGIYHFNRDTLERRKAVSDVKTYQTLFGSITIENGGDHEGDFTIGDHLRFDSLEDLNNITNLGTPESQECLVPVWNLDFEEIER